MKKLLLIGFVLGLVTVVGAQVPHRSLPLLAPSVVSLTVSNTFAFTNLSSATSQGTNAAGLYWTNNYAQRVTVATNSGAGSWANSTTKVVVDVPLWSLRDGRVPSEPLTNGVNFVQSAATLAVTLVGGSGANTASTWVWAPVYDGVNESTAAAELWTVGFTPTTTTLATLVTNVPLYRWPGAKALRLIRVVPGDTDASSQVTLLDVSVNGFIPVN